jgi:hypothetical protein
MLHGVSVNKIVYLKCRVTEHNKPIGIIGANDVRPESELLKIFLNENKCDFCNVHVMYIENKTKSFEDFFEAKDIDKEHNENYLPTLAKILTLCVVIMALLVTGIKLYQDPSDFLKKRYWEYLTPLSIAIVAFASMADYRAKKFTISANLAAAVIATGVLVAGFLKTT